LEVIEIEALALIRSLITDSEKNYVIIDIGSKVTGINFVKNGFLQLSRSLNIGGETITSRISSVLNISVARAEQFKKDFGVSGEGFIPESIAPILDTIRKETEQLLTIYRAKSVNVDKIIITGGSSLMPGLVDYLSALGVEVEIGNPLLKVTYPKEVEAVLNRYASHLAIAIGLALNPER
jgi:Tfp pilus assembly PilM family ATPase